jgi:hypothetical protein
MYGMDKFKIKKERIIFVLLFLNEMKEEIYKILENGV